MLKPSHITNYVCALFIGALVLSNFQVTLMCFTNADSNWFTLVSSMMAEEESEESEKEEKEEKESSKEWMSFNELLAEASQSQLDLASKHLLNYKSICREVLSPPPDYTSRF